MGEEREKGRKKERKKVNKKDGEKKRGIVTIKKL